MRLPSYIIDSSHSPGGGPGEGPDGHFPLKIFGFWPGPAPGGVNICVCLVLCMFGLTLSDAWFWLRLSLGSDTECTRDPGISGIRVYPSPACTRA